MQAACCPYLGKFTLQSIIRLGFRYAEHVSARLPTQLRHALYFQAAPTAAVFGIGVCEV
jgi:hypothetical protein